MKYLDENGLLYYTQKIKTWLTGKVDKVEGKGLSTNDYTTTEKNKLAGIEAGANKTTVDSSMSASSTNPVQNKIIKSYVDDAISGITGFDFQVVESLPTTGQKGIIYLVAHSHGTGDIYDEYIWVTNKFEKIGNTDIDLSNYVDLTSQQTISGSKDFSSPVKLSSGPDYVTLQPYVDSQKMRLAVRAKNDSTYNVVAYKDEIPSLVAITNAEIDTICS